ncbi:MAG: phenylacetic acid degradation operon negative regulatory protein PaaX [Minwuia sp.]|nr:phenylacetic acid degradation operon negative regulatory protein PaaX [Minwuia sp.]
MATTLKDRRTPEPSGDAESAPATDVVQRLLEQVPVRAPSLIVTVWGDTISAHDCPVWLGSLIHLLSDFGLNERVVRTAVFRLQKDSWLQGRQAGRRSYYDLAPSGKRRSDAAHQAIYRAGHRTWDGNWLLLMTTSLAAKPAEQLKQDLDWMGFGTPAPGVYLHPDMDATEVRALLDDQGLADQVAVMQTSAEALSAPTALYRMVRDAWNLSALEAGYSDFLDLFAPVMAAIAQDGPLNGRDAFIVRTLLIHEFRRVTLRDPWLPSAVLGQDWPGESARQLCAALYRAVHEAATGHAMAVLQTADGGLPPPRTAYYDRYGGLG